MIAKSVLSKLFRALVIISLMKQFTLKHHVINNSDTKKIQTNPQVY